MINVTYIMVADVDCVSVRIPLVVYNESLTIQRYDEAALGGHLLPVSSSRSRDLKDLLRSWVDEISLNQKILDMEKSRIDFSLVYQSWQTKMITHDRVRLSKHRPYIVNKKLIQNL